MASRHHQINKINNAVATTWIRMTGALHPLPPVIGLGKFLSGMPLDQGKPALLRAPTLSATFSTSLLKEGLLDFEWVKKGKKGS